jgi:hypothetical protein
MTDANQRAIEWLETDNIPFATDGLSAPTIYLDAIKGGAVSIETAKMNLIEFKQHAITGETVAVHAATLVMPTSQLAAWGKFFTELAASLPKNVVPVHPDAE